ncbi:beta strand repeat-containing protein [Leptospira sp. WS60.C2]
MGFNTGPIRFFQKSILSFVLIIVSTFLLSCQSVTPVNLQFLFGSFFASAAGQGAVIFEAPNFLFTSENGKQAEFILRLNIEPNSSVRIGPITISDPTEGVLLSETFLEFTEDNWDEPHTVRLAGVDDLLADGNQNYRVQLGNIVTSDLRFSTQPLPVLSVVNTDNESSGVAASPVFGLLTSESGERGQISYVLQTRPMQDVYIRNFVSNDTTEATVSASELVFTPNNWDVPQSITVTGVDDFSVDDSTFQISADPTISFDPAYMGKPVPIITGTNVDNDIAGFTVVNLSGLTTTEEGGAVTFGVVLNTLPTHAVTIPSIVATPGTEGTASPTTLTFAPAEWFTPKIVTVTGVDEFIVDGSKTVSIVASAATSTDTDYNGLAGPVFPSVTNTDNDVPGFVLTTPGSLTISENAGVLNFAVRLSSQPPPGFTVTLTGISENNAITNVNTNSLVFTNSNWNIDQIIQITTNDNFIDEDARTVTLQFGSVDTGGSADPVYNSVSPPSSIIFTVTDDDTAGFTVTPVGGLVVNENGTPFTETFTVVLNSQPTQTVNIATITSSNTSEITVSPASLSFTTANWNVAQTVTITTVLDGVDDGDKNVNINFSNSASSDPKYNAVSIPAVTAINTDSNEPLVRIQNLSGSTLSENGTSTITFEIRLSLKPDANVMIGPITSSDGTEAVLLNSTSGVAPSRTLTFTPTNGQVATYSGNASESGWNVPQIITIRSVADSFDDGNIPVTIHIPQASGSFFTGLYPTGAVPGYTDTNGNLVVTVTDDDTKGFTISTTTLNLTEGGANGTFTVRLNAAPCDTPGDLTTCASGSVTIPITQETFSLPDTTQYTFSPASLTFTHTNFATAQTVTVSVVNDAINETNTRTHTLTLGAISGSGTDYEGQNPNDITINIADNDNPNPKILFTLDSGQPYFTAESGLSTFYSLRLGSRPIPGNTVTVTISSSDATEGMINNSGTPVSSKQFVFDETNWSTSIPIEIVGISDALSDGNVSYNITVSGTETGSFPSWYDSFVGSNGATANLVNYSISENPITVITPQSMVRAETAAAFSIYILLSQAPTDDVTIPISSSTSFPCQLFSTPTVSQFNISVGSVTLTSANWNTIGAHNTITVTPFNDAVDDGNVTCPIIVGILSSSDGFYNGINPFPSANYPELTLNDNDTSGLTTTGFTPATVITSQSGATSEFYIHLNSQPTADVTINFAVAPSGLVQFPTAPLTFTPSNFGTGQLVTVQGQDTVDLTDVNFNITPQITSSESGTGFSPSTIYSALTPSSIPGIHLYNLYDIIPCTNPNIVSACGTSPNSSGGLVTSPNLITSENGAEARFQVRLRARPTSNVTINVNSSNMAEGTVSSSNLTFTSTDWNTFQNIVITGVDDGLIDGTILYSILFGSLSGGGSGFNGESLPSVFVSNQDND